MSAPAAQERWQAPKDICWTHYSDSEEWVVYHPGSSCAHLVTEAARRLWILVADGRPCTVESLATQLSAETGPEPLPDLIDAVRDTLAFMDSAGLITPLRA